MQFPSIKSPPFHMVVIFFLQRRDYYAFITKNAFKNEISSKKNFKMDLNN